MTYTRRILHYSPGPTDFQSLISDQAVTGCSFELNRMGGCGAGELQLTDEFANRNIINVGDWIAFEYSAGDRWYMGRVEHRSATVPAGVSFQLEGMGVELGELFAGGFNPSNDLGVPPHRYAKTDLFPYDPDYAVESVDLISEPRELVILLMQQYVVSQSHITLDTALIDSLLNASSVTSMKFRGEESIKSIIKDLALRAGHASWGVQPDGKFFYLQKPTTVAATWRIGTDIISLEETYERNQLYNRIMLTGGYVYDERVNSNNDARGIYRWRGNYTQPASRSLYGERRIRMNIPWIRTATDSREFAREFFRVYAEPTKRYSLEVGDQSTLLLPWNSQVRIEDQNGQEIITSAVETVRVQFDHAPRFQIQIGPDDPQLHWPEPNFEERWEIPSNDVADQVSYGGNDISLTSFAIGNSGNPPSSSSFASSYTPPSSSYASSGYASSGYGSSGYGSSGYGSSGYGSSGYGSSSSSYASSSSSDESSSSSSPPATAPTVTLTTPTTIVNGMFVVTATFSEPVTGMEVGDFNSLNGINANFNAVSTTVYTVEVTPTGGLVAVDILDDVVQDAEMNGNITSNQLIITNDTTAPSVTLTTPTTTVNSMFVVTATFDEPVTGMEVGDFNILNGTAANFNAISETVYTVEITPTGGLVAVDILADVVQDAATNGNITSNQLIITNNSTTPPSCILTTPAIIVNGMFVVTATFSKSVTGMEVGDFNILNGTAANFNAVSLTVYTVEVTPTGGLVAVDILADVVQDSNMNGNTTSNQLIITNDTTAPSVTLTTPADPVTEMFVVTATFDETVTGITDADFVVANGTKANFTAVDGDTYTVEITPTGTPVTIDMPAAAGQDTAGNDSLAATQLSVVYDAPPATCNTGTTSVLCLRPDTGSLGLNDPGTQVTLTYAFINGLSPPSGWKGYSGDYWIVSCEDGVYQLNNGNGYRHDSNGGSFPNLTFPSAPHNNGSANYTFPSYTVTEGSCV